MPTERQDFPLPPLPRTNTGAARRIGVEIELGGLELEAVVAVVADFFGGRIAEHGRYERAILGDQAGPWQVEIDFAWLKELGRRERDAGDALAGLEEAGEDLVRAASAWMVPVEVVSPPLPLARLAEIDALIARLRAAGAQGTGGSLINAFGLQINPEVPATDATTLRRYLQAFLCLFDWLQGRAQVDLARRLTAFVAPFPKAYVRLVVDPDYRPDLAGLIDDYLAANPTRNRALDLLPLFLHLDPERVRRVVDDPRVTARPTLHYRLPNSEVDRPGWGVRPVWEDWLQIEHLVAEPERLATLCRAYADFLDRPLSGLIEDWTTESRAWLKAPDDL